MSTGRELGTAIYVHNKVTYNKINFNQSKFQISAVRLHLPDNKFITICNIYNQPNENYDLGEIPNILSRFEQPILLVGDFNAHSPLWDNSAEDADGPGRKIEDLIVNSNYCCLNEDNCPTYFSKTHGTYSAIDLSICSNTIVDEFEWNVLDDMYTSDHYPITMTYLIGNTTPLIPRYNIEKADWELYDKLTSKIPTFDPNNPHDDIANLLKEFINDSAKKSIPISKGHPSKIPVPWWSNELSKLVKEKHTLSRRLDRINKRFNYINNSNEPMTEKAHKLVILAIEIIEIKPMLNKTSAKFKKAVKEGKIISWRKYISSLSSETPIKNIWHMFRKINGSHAQSPRFPIKHNGQIIHDRKNISNIIGNHLQVISSNTNVEDHFKKIKNSVEKITLNFDTENIYLYNNSFTMEELEDALNSTNESSPGEDKITFSMIKHLNNLAKSYLLKFYNLLWHKKVFPKIWRHAIVLPIAKPGKDPRIVTNYRPISLTSCLCKTMEKMINNRLTWYLEKNQILSPSQSGSRKNKSTLDSLTSLENQIKKGFERKKVTVAVYFDIQKAYDTTWRYNILRSLYDHGFRGELPTFIKNFMSERTFQVRIENIYSDIFKLQNGIPQGSVLSGTLFIMAINNIVTVLPKGVQNSLYIDDFAIFYTSNNLRHIQRILNMAISRIDQWATSVGFRFSTEKTKAIVFYRDKRWIKDQEIELKFRNTSIRFYENVKFLGLIFDQHLNWKAHIRHVKGRALKAMNLIKKLSHVSWGADRKTLMMLYKSTVLSIMDYGSPIYSSASDAALKILDPVHHLGIRLATGAFKSSPVTSLIAESGELPLYNRFEQNTMQRALKLKISKSPVRELFINTDQMPNCKQKPSLPIRANTFFNDNNINVNEINNFEYNFPPWTRKLPKICSKLNIISKRNINDNVLKQLTEEHKNEHADSIAIYTDGSKSKDGVGFAVISTTFQIKSSLPNNASIYTAELMAIKSALIKVIRLNLRKVVLYSDSLSAIEGINSFR